MESSHLNKLEKEYLEYDTVITVYLQIAEKAK